MYSFASTFEPASENLRVDLIRPVRNETELLIHQSAFQKPFLVSEKAPLRVPIFSFVSGQFHNETIQLDQEFFNQPLRRDLIHNVYHYWKNFGKRTYKLCKRSGDVAGSGKKPTPQKGQGAARKGNKRAHGRVGGGKAWGPVPRDLTFPINAKVRLLALKCMLSAKLFEDKLVFIDSEAIELPKTQILEEIVSPFKKDKLCFLTGKEVDSNFNRAVSNL
jgi:large subunit ribosomal protein L4